MQPRGYSLMTLKATVAAILEAEAQSLQASDPLWLKVNSSDAFEALE